MSEILDGLSKAFEGAMVDAMTTALAKAQRDVDGRYPMTLAEAKPQKLPPEPAQDEPKGLLFDPFALIDQLGYRDRPSGLTYQTLRHMARKVPTFTAIEQIRINQVCSFAQPQEDERDPGFAIELRDPKKTPGRKDRQRMHELTDWVLQTGSAWGPTRDDFRTFLHKLTRDSLELDQATFEVGLNRSGVPGEFVCLDGATMRLADIPPGAEHRPDLETIKYVQVYDEMVIGEFPINTLCWGVRNPRSDIRANGYGYSELEMLLNVITASLWAFEYNKKFFSQGTSAKGVINLKGGVPDSKMDAFRRMWQMMIAGVGNAHRTPTVSVDEVQWIDLHKSNLDMEYSAWMDWLIKITCATTLMDPAELNFSYGNSGQSSQMFQAPVEQKLKQSKDRGLRPLLSYFAKWLNTHLIWRLDPNYRLVFKGLDAKGEDQKVDLAQKKSKFLMTIDELRAEEDLKPLPDGQGAIILDPTFLQNKQAMEMAAQGEEEEGGEEGEEPAEAPGVPGIDDQEPEPDEEGEDFESLFGGGEKSMSASQRLHASRQRLESGRLLDSDPLQKARVTVYEIEL